MNIMEHLCVTCDDLHAVIRPQEIVPHSRDLTGALQRAACSPMVRYRTTKRRQYIFCTCRVRRNMLEVGTNQNAAESPWVFSHNFLLRLFSTQSACAARCIMIPIGTTYIAG